MSNTSTTEKRSLLVGAAPVATGRTIKGLAARFNSRSENLGTADRPVFEVIQPGAFDGRLNDDVAALLNHDQNLVLARSRGGKGTLKLWIDTTGLWYEFQAPNTTVGNDLLENIRLGNVDQSSFSFSVAAGGDSFKSEAKGGTLRTISKIGKLFDVSPVLTPAYAATSVSARSKSNKTEHPSVTIARRRLLL